MNALIRASIALLAMVSFVDTSGQTEGDVWVMGYTSMLPSDDFGLAYWDFSSRNPVIQYDLDVVAYISETCASISKNGGVLMITNGMEVFTPNGDRIIDTMAYGTAWTENYSYSRMLAYGFRRAQTALILPTPNRNNEYTLIYHNSSFDHENFYFLVSSVLEAKVIHHHSDSFEIVYKDKEVLKKPEFLSQAWPACRHANGRDWWIVNHDFQGDQYYIYLLDQSGLHVVDSAAYYEENWYTHNAWFSHDGSQYARYVNATDTTNILNLYDFDRCAGRLYNRTRIVESIESPRFDGMAFSPDGRYVFVTTNGKEVYQYNLSETDIAASRTLVDTNDGYVEPGWLSASFGPMMPGPDGRIYMFPSLGASRIAHIIGRPNEKGRSSQLMQHEIVLQTAKYKTVQNFPNFRLGPLDGSPCDTLGIDNYPVSWWRHEMEAEDPAEIRFTDLSYFRPEVWAWDFGDGETSSDQNPIHTYPGPGLYHACLTVSNEFSSDSSCHWIEIMSVATEETSSHSYDIFPNPFTDHIEIHPSGGFSTFSVHLTDITGASILSRELTCPCRLKLEHLPAGVYFYRIEEEGRMMKSGKIVKM